MKIQRYETKNMQEAIEKAKSELGRNAVIVSTRRIRRKGLLGFFQRPILEVIAAVEEKEEVPKQDFIASLKQSQQMVQIEEKIKNIESVMSKVYGEIKDVKYNIEDSPENSYISVVKLFYQHLIQNGVEPEVAKVILDDVNQEAIKGQNSINTIVSLVCNKIISILGTVEPIQVDDTTSKPRKVMLLGSTGVGKTTTIAKLTAEMILNHQKKVGLITCDTYRIAAVEQLKTYAEILGVTVKVVYQDADIQSSLEEFSDKDIVFIDTAGRSHNNKQQMQELEELINQFQPHEIYLVLNMVTKYKDIQQIIEHYSFIKDYKFIFTKLDETSSYGMILSTCFDHPQKLSYITTGQNVPDDIEIVKVDNIAKSLLGSIQK